MKSLFLSISGIIGIQLYSSFCYGFELKFVFFSLYYLLLLSGVLIVFYLFFSGVYIPEVYICAIAGLFFSFSLYPLLDFYSFKPEGYNITDWISFREERLNFEFFEIKWYGRWYGKLGLSGLFIIFSIIFFRLFEKK